MHDLHIAASWFDSNILQRELSIQNVRPAPLCSVPMPKENGIALSDRPASLMLLADYAMGDKLAVYIHVSGGWTFMRIKSVPKPKASYQRAPVDKFKLRYLI